MLHVLFDQMIYLLCTRSKGGVESSSSTVYGKFDDTKGVIRSRNWKMDRQYKKLIV